MSNNEWKKIKGFEKYYITNEGMVYSTVIKRYLKLQLNSYGYCQVSLKTNKNTKLVHRLVAEHFILNPENKKQVNHKDGNKLNNKVENLEWCTPGENIKHAFESGLIISPNCEKHYCSKIKNDDIAFIKNLYKLKILNQPELSKIFNIDQGQISRIINNKGWKKIYV